METGWLRNPAVRKSGGNPNGFLCSVIINLIDDQSFKFEKSFDLGRFLLCSTARFKG